MSVGIPLPELDVTKPAPAPPPDALSEFQRAAQLNTAAAQQQAIQAQTVGQNQQNQMQALALKDQQTLRDLAPKYVQKDENGKLQGFDTNGYLNDAISSGVNPNTVNALRNQYYESVKNAAAATKAQRDNEQANNDEFHETLESLRALLPKTQPNAAAQPVTPGQAPNPAQPADNAQAPVAGTGGMPQFMLPGAPGGQSAPGQAPAPIETAAAQVATPEMMAAWHQALPKLMRLNPQGAGQLNPNQFPTAAQIDGAEAGLGTHAQALKDAETLAKTQEEAGKGAQGQAEAEAALWKPAGESTLMNVRTGQLIHGVASPNVEAFKEYVAKGGDPLNFAADQEGRQLGNKLQLSVMEKKAQEAISDGDPKAAAQLLIDGTVAPSQLISSRKPAFAQQAFSQAAQMQPGWNATKADADFKVASSPQNVGFFGSAKSLTDKGGTLDQLADAAKDIPQSQIPVFNTVADAVKASTGSGPIAKYAALALGVADDYAKVMGGGQGSDTSRNQALSLIASKQSPEQRAASIDGIRGAVTSQTNSRIGDNPVLKKMYGSQLNQPAQTSTSSGGHVIAIGDKQYRYNGTGSTADLANYTEVPK